MNPPPPAGPPDRRPRFAGPRSTGPRRPAVEEPVVIVESVVEKLVPGGQGLLRDDKGVFFADGGAPGERVRVAIAGKQGGARRGKVLEVLERAKKDLRQPLDCAVADRCGGCDWLHLTPAAQATWKLAIVDDALRRTGRFTDEELSVWRRPLQSAPADQALAGRRRIRLQVDGAGRLTLSESHSHRRVAVDDCAALHPHLRRILRAAATTWEPLPRASNGATELRLACDDDGVVAAVDDVGLARALWKTGQVRGVLITGQRSPTPPLGDPALRGEVSAGQFAAAVSDASTFAQATRFGGAAIRDAVMAAVDDVIAGATVLELFCGAGHLTLPLAQKAAKVVAVEGDAAATAWLKSNAVHCPDDVIEVHTGFIDGTTVAASSAARCATVVVMDPPRTGLVGAAGVFGALVAGGKVERLVMVSCDPATGARDLRAADDAGFQMESLVPIDAFPRTHHVEWVATLVR